MAPRTPLGDPIEIAALTQVFRAATPDVGFCRLGSLKANLGHLDAAAGVAGLIKTVLALSTANSRLWRTFSSPNPQLDLAQQPVLPPAPRAPPGPRDGPRRAGVSSFGIGGTNAHVVLEEAPAIASDASRRDQHLLVLSARTESALEQATANLAASLEGQPDVALVGCRMDTAGRAASVRAPASRGGAGSRAGRAGAAPAPAGAGPGPPSHEGGTRPVAFLFSGQGSQHAWHGRGAISFGSCTFAQRWIAARRCWNRISVWIFGI